MKILAFDHFKPGFSAAGIKPDLLKEEMAHVWRLWEAGTIRELYGRSDAHTAVVIFECETVEETRRYVEDFPLSKAGFLAWDFVPLIAPLPLEALFDAASMKAAPKCAAGR